MLGRGEAHRVGHLRHRAEAAGFEQLPGLVQTQLAQPGRRREARQLAQPAVQCPLAQVQQPGQLGRAEPLVGQVRGYLRLPLRPWRTCPGRRGQRFVLVGLLRGVAASGNLRLAVSWSGLPRFLLLPRLPYRVRLTAGLQRPQPGLKGGGGGHGLLPAMRINSVEAAAPLPQMGYVRLRTGRLTQRSLPGVDAENHFRAVPESVYRQNV